MKQAKSDWLLASSITPGKEFTACNNIEDGDLCLKFIA